MNKEIGMMQMAGATVDASERAEEFVNVSRGAKPRRMPTEAAESVLRGAGRSADPRKSQRGLDLINLRRRSTATCTRSDHR